MIYVINYDLNAPGQNYSQLISYLRSFSAYCNPHKSTWFVSSSLSASVIGAEIRKRIDSNDSYSVFQVLSPYDIRANKECVNWFNNFTL